MKHIFKNYPSNIESGNLKGRMYNWKINSWLPNNKSLEHLATVPHSRKEIFQEEWPTPCWWPSRPMEMTCCLQVRWLACLVVKITFTLCELRTGLILKFLIRGFPGKYRQSFFLYLPMLDGFSDWGLPKSGLALPHRYPWQKSGA